MIALIAVVSLLAAFHSTNAVSLGAYCDSFNTCTDPNTGCYKETACTLGTCVCISGFASNGTECVPEVLLGASCPDGYCSFGTCMGGTCQCAAGFNPSTDNRECLGSDLGEACSTVSDCQATNEGFHTVVCNGTCECAPGYVALDAAVCTYYGDQDPCVAGETECMPQGSCVNSTCMCDTAGYMARPVYITDGRSQEVCMDPLATEVSYGQTCNTGAFDATKRYCGIGLLCQRCPENLNSPTPVYVCLSDTVTPPSTTDPPPATTTSTPSTSTASATTTTASATTTTASATTTTASASSTTTASASSTTTAGGSSTTTAGGSSTTTAGASSTTIAGASSTTIAGASSTTIAGASSTTTSASGSTTRAANTTTGTNNATTTVMFPNNSAVHNVVQVSLIASLLIGAFAALLN